MRSPRSTCPTPEVVCPRKHHGQDNFATHSPYLLKGAGTIETPPQSQDSDPSPYSSSKRRRQNDWRSTTESVSRKLIYERNAADSTDDSDEEELSREELKKQRILREIRRINGEEEEDRVFHTTVPAKLFEYLTFYDVVSDKWLADPFGYNPETGEFTTNTDVKGSWVCRGSGCVRFIQCLEEGYNRGMVRMEMTKTGTLETIMCHEVTHEEAVLMPCKKGKAYTWSAKDWAYETRRRTFSIRFDDELEALKWKNLFEQYKANNCRVRRGLDIPDSAIDDVCSNFRMMSTNSTPSKS